MLHGYEPNGSGILIPAHRLIGHGQYEIEHIRGRRFDKWGEIVAAGEVIDKEVCDNLVVNEGLDYTLNCALANGASALTSWFVGIFSGNYTVLSSDTAAVIAANSTEITTKYTSATRPAWTPVESAQSVTNSAAPASFTFTGIGTSLTVYGAFLVSNSTKGGTSGTLFSGAQFGTSKTVVNSDILQVTYTYTLASA